MAIGDNLTKRDQTLIAVAVIAIGLAAAYWYFVYDPKNTELDTLASRVEQLENTNRRAKAEMAKGTAAELRAQARVYQQNLELMRTLVPTGNEVPALLEQVSTAARRVGLDIGAVRPQPIVSGDQFDTYRYQLSVIGGYHDLGQFLANVGSLRRIIAPVNLRLAPIENEQARRRAGSGEAVLRADFEIQTYVAKTAQVEESPRAGGQP